MTTHHGTTKAIGCSHMRLGNFCKMFNTSSWADDIGADRDEAEAFAKLLGGEGGVMDDQQGASREIPLPSGYTFFAQFVDHDITLDTESDLHGSTQDPTKLPNMRSASLDLDCVYGFGPEVSPHLYDEESKGNRDFASALLVGNAANPDDLPRNAQGRALIGDPRNDENLFVSQLQLVFLRFHNRRLKDLDGDFSRARTDCRNHYQYVVLNDLLARICDAKIYEFVRGRLRDETYPLFEIVDACGRICIPVEFSGAAYRFGHSLVRTHYPVNEAHRRVEIFDEEAGTLGFRQVDPAFAVDWSLLLPTSETVEPTRAHAIDHLLTSELFALPKPVVGEPEDHNDRSLAFRNLLRGYVLGLPSGQAAARALAEAGYPSNPDQDLAFADIPGWTNLPQLERARLEEHTPLFFYILREAGVRGGDRLGPVASAILLETFCTMLLRCDSYLTTPGWTPDSKIAGDSPLTLADIVRYANGG
ncbi:hypothetical protein G6O69_04795 [Pseudenhygromyxa sp. WMMC2535]|uniref:peroxidase family protein n=1 Tax=Pseudenhygromyxa sp. WMMC2535 TaxID=2712867 RepID=UPI001554DA49|nr:peroxidase family protein [Pseudenhygromyxa sp. WMMC2535]NVB37137.1 hypothetical protein [Pseudenhygromyxa sp. WMMC2535]